MATNDKYQEIIKEVFAGNIGRQMRLLRERIEYMEFMDLVKLNSWTITNEQQTWIDRHLAEYKKYEDDILKRTNQTRLIDKKPYIDPLASIYPKI